MASLIQRLLKKARSVLRLDSLFGKKGVSMRQATSQDQSTIILAKLGLPEPVTLARLVKETSGELGQGPNRVVAEIMRLQAEGRLRVAEPAPYKTLPGYLFSPYSFWFWEVVVATLSSMGSVLFSSGALFYVRVILGGLLVLFLPGYLLVSVIYPKNETLDGLTRAVSSFVLSLAVVTLVGFALNYTPFGISLSAVVVSLGTLTMVLALVSIVTKFLHYRSQRF